MRRHQLAHDGARKSRWGLLSAVLLGAVGCTAPFIADLPGPDTPRLTQLDITPKHVAYGCPVTLSFRFEDAHGDLVRAYAAWRVPHHTRGVESRVLTLPMDAAQLAGQTKGEVRVPLSLEQYGTTVWYDVQVEDATGRKSNVLSTSALMDGPWPWDGPTPWCG